MIPITISLLGRRHVKWLFLPSIGRFRGIIALWDPQTLEFMDSTLELSLSLCVICLSHGGGNSVDDIIRVYIYKSYRWHYMLCLFFCGVRELSCLLIYHGVEEETSILLNFPPRDPLKEGCLSFWGLFGEKTRMEWNQDLNSERLGMELESRTQLFGENWNGIRFQTLLFGKQLWNGNQTCFYF